MSVRVLLFAVLFFLATIAPPVLAAEDGQEAKIIRAKELFAKYVLLVKSFDPAVADLYADEAKIRDKRTDDAGKAHETTLSGTVYKDRVRSLAPHAKAGGQTSSYSEVRYAIERDGVRITADRYSEVRRHSNSFSLFVKPSPSGVWLIFEELSEHQF